MNDSFDDDLDDFLWRKDPYFRYEPLPQHCIRLLHILPYDGDDRSSILHVAMEVADMRTDPEFITLSYTWGSTSRTSTRDRDKVFVQEPRCFPIICDGKILRGTRNLQDALWIIRYMKLKHQFARIKPDLPEKLMLPIWVDALCINQDDIQERSEQVLRMTEVYGRSQMTIGWIGREDDDDSSKVVRMLKTISDLPQEVHDNLQDYNCHGVLEDDLQKKCGIRDPFSPHDWVDLRVFLSRIWFSRTWVLQEIVLSSRLILVCGDLQLDWDVLGKAINFLWRTEWYRMYRTYFWQARASIPEARLYNVRDDPESRLGAVNLARERRKAQVTPSFTETMFLAFLTECTDPRDKIYGLLSVAKEFTEGEVKIKPDYSRSVQDVYVEAVGIALKTAPAFEFISVFQDPSRPKMAGLPSWCPDFTGHFPGVWNPDFTEYEGDISKYLPSITPEVLPDSHFLSVSGVRLTVVEETCLHPKLIISTPGEYAKVLEFISRLNFETGPYSRLGQTRMEVLWRTLLNDRCMDQKPVPSSTLVFLAIVTTLAWLKPQVRKEVVLLYSELDAADAAVQHLQTLEPASEPFCPSYKQLRTFLDTTAAAATTTTLLTTTTSTSLPPPAVPDVTRLSDRYIIHPTPRFNAALNKLIDLDNPSLLPVIGAFQKRIHEVWQNRSLVRTTDGYLGLATTSARPGDEIWVLSKGRVPYLLRPVVAVSENGDGDGDGNGSEKGNEEGKGKARGRYQWLGRVEVHRFLDREGLPRIGVGVKGEDGDGVGDGRLELREILIE